MGFGFWILDSGFRACCSCFSDWQMADVVLVLQHEDVLGYLRWVGGSKWAGEVARYLLPMQVGWDTQCMELNKYLGT